MGRWRLPNEGNGRSEVVLLVALNMSDADLPKTIVLTIRDGSCGADIVDARIAPNQAAVIAHDLLDLAAKLSTLERIEDVLEWPMGS